MLYWQKLAATKYLVIPYMVCAANFLPQNFGATIGLSNALNHYVSNAYWPVIIVLETTVILWLESVLPQWANCGCTVAPVHYKYGSKPGRPMDTCCLRAYPKVPN